MTGIQEPTAEQCTENAVLSETPSTDEYGGSVTFATWYPSMGGYVSKAVVRIGHADDGDPPCFEAYVWHDGEFPFSDGKNPRRLHHCEAEQFIEFGRTIERMSRGGQR